MRRFLLFTTLSLALAACQTDMLSHMEQQSQEIRLAGGFTRSDLNGTVPIPAGKTVYVWAKNGNASVFDAWKLTSSEGGILKDNSYGSPKYFPAGADKLTLHALCGNLENPPSGFDNPFGSDSEEEAFIHMVNEDQTTYEGDDSDFQRSDLLYASQQITKENQAITFKHMLSKIEVVLKAGEGVSAEELNHPLTSVRLMNTRLRITVKPGAESPLSLDKDDTTNPTTPIYIDTKTTESFAALQNGYAQAVIIPQTLGTPSQKVPFISVYLGSNGATLEYKVYQAFRSGYKYTYHITVNEDRLTGIRVQADGEDNSWNAGNTTEIEGTERTDEPIRLITVADHGYGSSTGTKTRATTDTQYRTTFEEGDVIGVFGIQPDNADNPELIMNNTPLTLTRINGELVWMPHPQSGAAGMMDKLSADATYFAYYPYHEQVGNVWRQDYFCDEAETFFSNEIANWLSGKNSYASSPTVQDSPEAYAAKDLMVSKGTVGMVDGVKALSFGMRHTMSLVVIDFSRIDALSATTPPSFDGFLPYQCQTGVYRYLVPPGKEMSLSGTYATAGTATPKRWDFRFTHSGTAGTYDRYIIK